MDVRNSRKNVLPAHAGMVPDRSPPPCSSACAPRARGDGPGDTETVVPRAPCSPRTRGWSPWSCESKKPRRVLPAHAGMVPLSFHRSYKSYRCSPRTRGWSPQAARLDEASRVLPAHAGMVPAGRRSPTPRAGAPRARGDGPRRAAFADTTGGCSPRTRGWSLMGRASLCSPRTRGWSRRGLPAQAAPRVLPAHAGMVPLAMWRYWS